MPHAPASIRPSIKNIIVQTARHVKRNEIVEQGRRVRLKETLVPQAWPQPILMSRYATAEESSWTGDSGEKKKTWWIIKPILSEISQESVKLRPSSDSFLVMICQKCQGLNACVTATKSRKQRAKRSGRNYRSLCKHVKIANISFFHLNVWPINKKRN